MSMTPSSDPSPGQFTTCWSQVIAAGSPDIGDPEALAVHNACWYPLYAVRRRDHAPNVGSHSVSAYGGADRSRADLSGPLRSFLRAVCDHQLSDQRVRNALKRGGGRLHSI